MATTTRVEEHSTRAAELAGWPVRITSWRLAGRWRCEIDNVDPGAVIARADGASREAVESEASARAEARLARTRVF